MDKLYGRHEGWKNGVARQMEGRKEGRKEMFYLLMHSKHFIYGYMAFGHMVKDLSDRERKPAATATWVTLSN